MSDTTTNNTETAAEGEVSNATPEDVHQADTPSSGDQNRSPDGSDSESDPDDAGLSRRDIKYRERLRETEAERDTLRATVETMQRREVERLAAEHLVKPGILWTVGTELADLLDDDGAVDPEKVSAAAVDARQQHGLEDPQAARKRQPRVPLEGRGNTQAPKNAWSDAFR
ncbi:hypothetical protein FIV07_01985 [Mycobacterium sp. THAF192]|nr:hypothetical protein FIV07_01985 [Mycobacterium sp. THAF192]